MERKYGEDVITVEERGTYLKGLETKDILINFRQHLTIEKSKDPFTVTAYLSVALSYLDVFWNNIFAYFKDGRYPIDNNATECAVRLLTIQRNSMLHFGSDEGGEMSLLITV